MINKANASLSAFCVHQIGNASQDQGIKLSNTALSPTDEEMEEALLHYFIDNFKEPSFYHFTFTADEVELNPVFNYASNIFDDPTLLLEQSTKIARHLYEKSTHPNIKEGDLMVGYIKDVLVDDEMVNAIAIFKSEQKDTFIKLDPKGHHFDLNIEEGINIEKLDKACLIFETEREQGYKITIIDKSNRQYEAQYWRDDFLFVKSRNDDYQATTQYISLTKSYVKEKLKSNNEISKIDEADILHRSKAYMTHVERFELSDFEDAVFKNEKMKASFQEFSEDFEKDRGIRLPEKFDISTHAVKKKNQSFRSVIKLDKNFHIYVHGDRTKIERVEDIDGTKYYKLFFDTES